MVYDNSKSTPIFLDLLLQTTRMESITYWLTLSLPIPILLLVYLRRRRPSPTNHCSHSLPLIGNLLPFIRNRHRFLDWVSDLLSDSPSHTIEVRGLFPQPPGVCTADPRVVDHLLRTNFPNYVKGDRFGSVLSDLLGQGIFNVDAHLWALQRKIASREFTTRSLRFFVADVVRSETHSRLLPLLSAAAEGGTTLDLQDVLRRFGFDNICAVAFGTDPAALDPTHHHQPFFQAFDDAVEISSARILSPVPLIWKVKRALNIGSERRLWTAIRTIDDYAMNVIAQKESKVRDCNSKKEDLLSRFMVAVQEEDGDLGHIFGDEMGKKRFIRDIVVSFVLAGKDSTSSALTWFFWLLWANPRCERRIYAEVTELEEESDTYDELKGMRYLSAAISESLRLYPPVPIDSREVVADDELPDGTRVRAGWFADYSAYAMARSEAVWGEDCREFVPERWLDERGEFVAVEPCKFPVFHAGPRMCLGREMAYVQMKAVATAVLRAFEVEVVDGCREVPPAYQLALTLRMKRGFPVRFKRRRRIG